MYKCSVSKKRLCIVTATTVLSSLKRNLSLLFKTKRIKQKSDLPGIVIAPATFQFFRAGLKQKTIIASSHGKLPILFAKGVARKTKKSKKNSFKIYRMPAKTKEVKNEIC